MTAPPAPTVGAARCHGIPTFPVPVEGATGAQPVDDLGLRFLTVIVLVCGLAGMAKATLLTTPLALSGALGCAGASAAAWHWRAGAGPRIRRMLSSGALLGTFAAVARASGATFVDDLGPTLAMTLVGLAVAHCLVEDTRRDLVVGVLIGSLMLVLAAGVAPGAAIGVPVVGGWLVVLAVLVVAHRSAARDLAHVAAAPPPGVRAGTSVPATVLRSVGVVLLVGAFLLLLVPHPDGLSLRSRLARSDVAQSTGPVTRAHSTFDGGSMNLLARGGLSEDPVLQVPADSPILWRGTVLDTYADNTWWSSPASMPAGSGVYPPAATIPPGPLEGPVRDDAARIDIALPYPAFSGIVVAPGRVTNIQSQSQVIGQPGFLVLAPGGAPTAGAESTDAYLVTSIPTTDIHSVRGPSGATPDGVATVDPIWTTLPPTVPARVRDLGRSIVTPTTDPAEAVLLVEDFVRHRAQYTLDPPLPGRGEDAVDDFLFDSHQGFCEHFASAEVVLLRAAGIPARVVTGYSTGTDNGDGSRTFHGTDAHAWVEAWLPGHGWVSSDPTAGAQLAETGHGLSAITHRLSAVLHSAAGRLELAALLAVAVLLAFAVVHLRRRVRSRRLSRAGRLEDQVEEPDPLPAFHRLEAVLISTGAGREPAESVTELARRLPTDALDADAFRAVDETCYAATPPDVSRRSAAADRLDAFTAAWRRRH